MIHLMTMWFSLRPWQKRLKKNQSRDVSTYDSDLQLKIWSRNCRKSRTACNSAKPCTWDVKKLAKLLIRTAFPEIPAIWRISVFLNFYSLLANDPPEIQFGTSDDTMIKGNLPGRAWKLDLSIGQAVWVSLNPLKTQESPIGSVKTNQAVVRTQLLVFHWQTTYDAQTTTKNVSSNYNRNLRDLGVCLFFFFPPPGIFKLSDC